MRRFLLSAVMILMTSLRCLAVYDGYLPYNIVGDPSGTAPYFFGPSAFPIPDMLKNTSGRFQCQLNGDFSWGNLTPATDYAATFGFKLVIPLWTERANLSAYGQFHEWYWDTPEVRAVRRVDPKYALNGNCAGDVYISMDMRVLNESKYVPRTTVRATIKTASGDDYEKARYFDAPGYIFDACLTKTVPFACDVFFKCISASFNFGFVCWQTDMGCQNDAFLFAGSVELDTKYVNASVDLGKFSGREHYFDQPTSLKVRLEVLPEKRLNPFVLYQKGLKDWPFRQIRGGLTYTF